MLKVQEKMIDTARKLLAEGTVDLVIGFRNGAIPATARPFFARTPEEAEALVWNAHCSTNLAVYLPSLFEKPKRPPQNYKPPRIALVAKGCDARSVAGLAAERQISRENLVVIGMPCEGMTRRVGEGADTAEERLSRACEECIAPVVKDADIVIEGKSREPSTAADARVKEFESLPIEKRWEIFTAEMSRCIRCNACREACPNCYCKVCFADRRKTEWISPANTPADTMMFHLGRMFHQAGRCVECDACANACPMGIDLRLFTRKLAADVRDLYGCIPGVRGDGTPPLNTFRHDDTECFITDPEER
jgi:formate dehydrogenase subunit beta